MIGLEVELEAFELFGDCESAEMDLLPREKTILYRQMVASMIPTEMLEKDSYLQSHTHETCNPSYQT